MSICVGRVEQNGYLTCSSQKNVCGNVTVNLVPENIWFWPSLISSSLSLVAGVVCCLLFVIQVRSVDDATPWDHFNTENRVCAESETIYSILPD